MSVWTRDIPRITTAWSDLKRRTKNEVTLGKKNLEEDENYVKPKDASYWAVFTTGAGLFSDGYVNNSIGVVSTCLKKIYGTQYTTSHSLENVSSIAFAGTILGMLTFGYLSDMYSRKNSMMIGCLILILFSILCAGAWGVGTTSTNAGGLFAAITAFRFFLGVGIGAEYPAGSAAAAEASSLLPPGKRNRYFVIFTNFMIDFGFVIAAFVPMVLLWIFKEKRLNWVWRLSLGLGAIPPLSLFLLRLKYKEGETFKKNKFTGAHIPYWTVIKFYWFRLLVVSIIWFIYDFASYSFGIFSSYILAQIIPDGNLYKAFGWNVVLNLFYLPGSFLGAFASDYFGPRITLVTGLVIQSAVGFAMAASYDTLKNHVGGFVVVYGIFMTLGEFGPGDNMGLLASKTCATPVRGHYYAIAAVIGKVGAFVGTYIFPIIIKNAGGENTTSGLQAPYWVSSSLCIFSAILGLFFLPDVHQSAIQDEDERFLQYLASTGYDMSTLGDGNHESESIEFGKNQVEYHEKSGSE